MFKIMFIVLGLVLSNSCFAGDKDYQRGLAAGLAACPAIIAPDTVVFCEIPGTNVDFPKTATGRTRAEAIMKVNPNHIQRLIDANIKVPPCKTI